MRRQKTNYTSVQSNSSDAIITRLLIIVCVFVYFKQVSDDSFTNSIALHADTLTANPRQLVTSMFAHGSIIHLFVNMYALWILGSQLESSLGKVKYLTVYAVGGLAGGLAFIASNPSTPAVGASGAIFALLGVALPYTRYNGRLIAILLLNVVIGFVIPNIAWQAHFGGLAAGFLLGFYWFNFQPQKKTTTAY